MRRRARLLADRGLSLRQQVFKPAHRFLCGTQVAQDQQPALMRQRFQKGRRSLCSNLRADKQRFR
jgi:hypothetical protein